MFLAPVLQLYVHEAQSLGRCCHAELSSIAGSDSAKTCARFFSTSPDVDQGSRDDAHHVVEEPISLDMNIEAACIVHGAVDIDDVEASNRHLSVVVHMTERGKVVLTYERGSFFFHQREIECVADTP